MPWREALGNRGEGCILSSNSLERQEVMSALHRAGTGHGRASAQGGVNERAYLPAAPSPFLVETWCVCPFSVLEVKLLSLKYLWGSHTESVITVQSDSVSIHSETSPDFPPSVW